MSRVSKLLTIAALSAFGAYSDYNEFYSDARCRRTFNTKKKKSFTKEQLKVLGDVNRKQLHTFIIKGEEILAYSKKDAIKRYNHKYKQYG